MKTILTIICCLALAMTVSGQEYRIQGILLDRTFEEPIYGATVFDPNSGRGVLTDEQGQFQLSLPKIPDAITIRYDGKDSILSDIKLHWPTGNATFDLGKIYLGQDAYPDIGPEPPRRPILDIRTITILGYINQMDNVKFFQYVRGDQTSIEQGLNLVPGVRFESRGPGGSRRLAIRGGFLRSQFGVRDVKAYLDGAPLTSPDGSTPLELIDHLTLSETKILKGPCASEYGPVSNGVVLFNAGAQPAMTFDYWRDGRRGSGGYISQAIGSYGYLRTAAQVSWRERLSLTYVRQRYAGYRAQEANAKDFLQLTANHTHQRHRFDGSLLLYQGSWGLPGSLDSTQVAADPRQALAISQALDAHVERRHARLNMKHGFQIKPSMILTNAAYIHLADKVNPFGTSAFNQGYKVENSQGLGGRSVWQNYSGRFTFKAGAEYQVEWLDGKQFENNLGSPGALQISALTRSTQAHALAEVGWNRKHHRFTGQGSLAQVAYAQKHAFSSLEPIANGKSQLKPAAAGALIWGYKTTDEFRRHFFVKVATSYSPPALWEITDSVGRLRSDLQPESGINLEWRGLGNFWGDKLHGEANVYHHSIWNTIVPQTLSSNRVVYENQGRTTQMGIEAMAQLKDIFAGRDINRKIWVDFSTNGAFQYYYFNDYVLNGRSFKGKAIPGVPRFTWNAMLDFGFRRRWPGLQLTSQVIGKSYLDNANTVAQPTYCLLNAKIYKGFSFQKSGSQMYGTEVPYSYTAASLALSIGLNNALGTQYTNFPQLNAAAGRYYNPAPGRNWYAGVDFRF